MKFKLILLIFLHVFLFGLSYAERIDMEKRTPEEIAKDQEEYREREIQSKISESDNVFIGKVKSAKQFEYSSGDWFLGKIEIEIEPLKNIKWNFNTNQLLYIHWNCDKKIFYQLGDKGITCESVIKEGENIFLVASILQKYWTPFINKNTIEMMSPVSSEEIKNINNVQDVFYIFSDQKWNSVFKINYVLYVIIFLWIFGIFLYFKKSK